MEKFINLMRFIAAFSFLCFYVIIVWILFFLNDEYTPNRFKNKIRLFIKDFFAHAMMAVFYILLPRTFYTATSKSLYNKKKILFMSNHISEFDFVFMLKLFYLKKLNYNTIFVMKEEVLSLPIFGDVCRYCDFVTIDRSSSKKLEKYKEDVENLGKDDVYSFVLFPEGTIYTHETHANNLKYCKLNGYRTFENVLYPKPGGIHKSLEILMKDEETVFLDSTIFFNPFANNYTPLSEKFRMLMFDSAKFNINIITEIKTKECLKEGFVEESFVKKEQLVTNFREKFEIYTKDEFVNIIKSVPEYNINELDIEELTMFTPFGSFLIILYVLFIVKMLK